MVSWEAKLATFPRANCGWKTCHTSFYHIFCLKRDWNKKKDLYAQKSNKYQIGTYLGSAMGVAYWKRLRSIHVISTVSKVASNITKSRQENFFWIGMHASCCKKVSKQERQWKFPPRVFQICKRGERRQSRRFHICMYIRSSLFEHQVPCYWCYTPLRPSSVLTDKW